MTRDCVRLSKRSSLIYAVTELIGKLTDLDTRCQVWFRPSRDPWGRGRARWVRWERDEAETCRLHPPLDRPQTMLDSKKRSSLQLEMYIKDGRRAEDGDSGRAACLLWWSDQTGFPQRMETGRQDVFVFFMILPLFTLCSRSHTKQRSAFSSRGCLCFFSPPPFKFRLSFCVCHSAVWAGGEEQNAICVCRSLFTVFTCWGAATSQKKKTEFLKCVCKQALWYDMWHAAGGEKAIWELMFDVGGPGEEWGVLLLSRFH